MAGKSAATKNIAIKYVGGIKATETIQLAPGNTTHDVLTKLGLGADYQLSDARKPELVFKPDDVLYAQVEDGDLVHCSSTVDAGLV